MPTGAELFIDAIQNLGIDLIFTLVGDHLNEVLEIAASRRIPIFDMRHESGVTHAADAWARITRKPSLSLVTGGPGHTNSLTGVATAFLAGSPLISVSGSRPTLAADRQAFQDIDQIGIVRPVVNGRPNRRLRARFRSIRARVCGGVSGRMGPVHLTIPADLFRAAARSSPPLPAPPVKPAFPPAAERSRTVARSPADAERPVIVAGSGAWWSKAEAELREFIERTQIPLYTITMARGAVSDEHPLSMGYADPSLNRVVLDVYQEADLILVFGKRLDFRLATWGATYLPDQRKNCPSRYPPAGTRNERRSNGNLCGPENDIECSARRSAKRAAVACASMSFNGSEN